jgi:hypothetical protein
MINAASGFSVIPRRGTGLTGTNAHAGLRSPGPHRQAEAVRPKSDRSGVVVALVIGPVSVPNR